MRSVEAKSPGGPHSYASTFYESGSQQSDGEDEVVEDAKEGGNQSQTTSISAHETDHVGPTKPIQKPRPNLAILDGNRTGGSDKASELFPQIISPTHDLPPGGWIGGGGRGNHPPGPSQQTPAVPSEKHGKSSFLLISNVKGRCRSCRWGKECIFVDATSTDIVWEAFPAQRTSKRWTERWNFWSARQ